MRRVLLDLIARTDGIDSKEVSLTDLLAGKGPRFTLSGKVYRLEDKLFLDLQVADRQRPDDPRSAACSGESLLTLVNACQDLVLRLFPELKPKEAKPQQVVVQQTIQQVRPWKRHHFLFGGGTLALLGSGLVLFLTPTEDELKRSRVVFKESLSPEEADRNYFLLEEDIRSYRRGRQTSLALVATSLGLYAWGLASLD